jgi:hypothetical protein
MTTMNCYLLYKKDGTCEVICTRCFVTLGVADRSDSVREMEALHFCDRTVAPKHRPSIVSIRGSSDTRLTPISIPIERIIDSYGTRAAPNLWMALLIIVSLLYVLPTVVELLAARHLNPWLAIILPGDIAGCAWLFGIFKMQRTALILYLLLTACEAGLYVSNVVSAGALIWIADLVPTLIVAGIIVFRLQFENTKPLLPIS